jgi:hypothetical protein
MAARGQPGVDLDQALDANGNGSGATMVSIDNDDDAVPAAGGPLAEEDEDSYPEDSPRLAEEQPAVSSARRRSAWVGWPSLDVALGLRNLGVCGPRACRFTRRLLRPSGDSAGTAVLRRFVAELDVDDEEDDGEEYEGSTGALQPVSDPAVFGDARYTVNEENSIKHAEAAWLLAHSGGQLQLPSTVLALEWGLLAVPPFASRAPRLAGPGVRSPNRFRAHSVNDSEDPEVLLTAMSSHIYTSVDYRRLLMTHTQYHELESSDLGMVLLRALRLRQKYMVRSDQPFPAYVAEAIHMDLERANPAVRRPGGPARMRSTSEKRDPIYAPDDVIQSNIADRREKFGMYQGVFNVYCSNDTAQEHPFFKVVCTLPSRPPDEAGLLRGGILRRVALCCAVL